MNYICCVTGFRFAAVLVFETPLSIGIRDDFAAVGRCSLSLRIYTMFLYAYQLFFPLLSTKNENEINQT